MSAASVRSVLGPDVVAAVARRPDLWPTAVVTGLHLAAPGWWRSWPPRPVPPADYLRFRLQTQYGAAGDRLSGPDAVGLLEWARHQRRLRR